jgi:hypothetical protein
MNIDALKKALAVAPACRFVVVTDALFWQLYDAMELRPRKATWRAPLDAACAKIMNTLLAHNQLPHADHLTDVTWHLTEHHGIRVIRGAAETLSSAGHVAGFEVY